MGDRGTLLVTAFVIGLLAMIATPLIKTQEENLPVASSKVKQAKVEVRTDLEGLTIEQQNVKNRLLVDNKIGAIKHLYIISPYSGKILLYSTVKGKVTSSGKRLTPATVNSRYVSDGFPIKLGNNQYHTSEVLQDDGTYGSSEPYIYWWDSKGIYHQHFLTGGQIVHVSDKILRVNPNEIQINLETDKAS